MIRCSAVSSFVFTLTDLLNKTLGPATVAPPPPVPCPCPALPPPAVPSFSALEPLLLVLVLMSPTLNLLNSGDSLLPEEDGSLLTTGRRTTGTAESGMKMLLQWRKLKCSRSRGGEQGGTE